MPSYELCGVTIDSDVRLPHLKRASGGHAACTIVRDTIDPQAPGVWFHQWRQGRRAWLSIARRSDDYLLRFHGLADFSVSRDGGRVTAAAADGLPEETFRHLLIDQVLPLALSRQGRVLLHASAVHVPALGTVAFVGQTGRGKSTLAAALAGLGGRIVTDDCLAIDVGPRDVEALPGYPGLRLWPGAGARALLGSSVARRVAHYSQKRRVPRGVLPFHGQRSPLRVLFVLSLRAGSGDPAAMRRYRPVAGLLALVRFAYLLDVEDRGDLARVFAALSEVAARVPIVRLRLREGYGRLPRAAALIRAYAAGLPPC